jgi:hypothetical protein
MEVLRNIRIGNGSVFLDGAEEFSCPSGEFTSVARCIYKHYRIDYPKFYKMSALSKLGFLAAELLLKDLDLSETDPDHMAMFFANASSSLHTDHIYQGTIGNQPSPAIFVYTLPNIVIGEICIRHGFKGEGIFFIQEHFDKEYLFEHAENHLKLNRSSKCMAGWIDIDLDGSYSADLYLLK